MKKYQKLLCEYSFYESERKILVCS